ncbi:hypothetical protein GCM10023205_84360 [Yinghuangia aomiensis]|uniref:Uncharacterized protein n=1 Tax=Yinghuangia aomiensis TaxID=676205 RepID=A0ABP9IH75_9ACTN
MGTCSFSPAATSSRGPGNSLTAGGDRIRNTHHICVPKEISVMKRTSTAKAAAVAALAISETAEVSSMLMSHDDTMGWQ